MRKALLLWLFLAATLFGFTACSGSTISTASVSVPEQPEQPPNERSGNAGKVENHKREPNPEESASTEEQGSSSEESNESAVDHSPFEYPDAVRGIYVTGHSAGGERFKKLLHLVDSTELNAMVIDVKDDYGYITFKLNGELDPYSKPYIKDPKGLIQILSDHKIYPIARVVVFKDSVLASQKPEYSFKNGGQLWKNGRGEAFVNPFIPEVWEHNLKIAKEAAMLGFQEIQFDYVRFPEGFEKRDKILTYSMGNYTKDKLEPRLLEQWEMQIADWDEKQKELKAKETHSQNSTEALPASVQPSIAESQSANQSETSGEQAMQPKPPVPQPPAKPVYDAVAARVAAVTDFVAYAKRELEPYGVKVSVDIFGYTATLPEAPGIGQNFSLISENVDVISSMIYPSHWGPGYFNIPKPDVEPYKLVQEYVKMEREKLAQLKKQPVSRPWIQDFTASWLGKGNYIKYGKKEVEAQIRALNEGGIKEFLIWNAGNTYTENVDYTPLNH